ncbi:MAG: indole-3-glycerol phosphate synthase TrpC [Thermoflexales bacterium]
MNKRAPFVTTDTFLDRILVSKAEAVDQAKRRVSPAAVIDAALQAPPTRDFVGALRRDTVALIAEVKKASPSKGVLIENFDPVALGKIFAENGAAAISVLTDEVYFMGQLSHLVAIRRAVSVPVLRKEFIIDPYQVYEARAAGADAVLLIVAALEASQLAELHSLILEQGMAALIEVHNQAELERAFALPLVNSASAIGINNRDLKTFHEDLGTTARLARLVPPATTLVAESAIRSMDDVKRMGQCGAHAVLVGESLLKADNIADKVREFSHQPRRLK